MHTVNTAAWRHEHDFGQGDVRDGERRTLIVALLTAGFMVVEIGAGVAFGSMALLADGLHMASHAVALGIAVAAYVYARRRASDARFSFGTGKVNALGGYTGALLLAGFSGFMAWESVQRFIHPVPIVFDQAIVVAVLGLLVNGVSVALLGVHSHAHERGDDHHDPGAHDHEAHVHQHHEAHGHDHHHGAHDQHSEGRDHAHVKHGHAAPDDHAYEDHNLRSAYLHVLADALTSVAAVVALLGGKYFGLPWLDPVMGVVGSVLVARWAWGLIRVSSGVLLDHQAAGEVVDRIKASLEGDGDERVVDLHVWSIGPGARAGCAVLVAHLPLSPDEYRARVPAELGLRHLTVELHRCHEQEAAVPPRRVVSA